MAECIESEGRNLTMKTIRTTVMAFAALAAMVGRAGESAEFRLDTMDGPRTARTVETIAYSTAWNNGDSVSVAVDGVAIKEANAPASGDVVWNTAQATPGTHTLTHTCGGETLTAVFEVVQAPLPDVVVHFNANGGVFRDKDGNEVTQFDQCFTYGEAQRLFTDELTPMKMDENGNQFLGWVRGTPNVYSDRDIIDGREEETFYEYDGTETTYYAVWSYTMKVVFCNSGHDLVPASLADHLKWCVVSDGDKWFRSGDSVQVAPGQQVLFLDYDATYGWVVGEFKIDSTYAPYYNSLTRRLTLDISNDYRDKLVNQTPSEDGSTIYVNVEPTGEGEVRFAYSYGIREGLRNFIKAEDVPFNASKVQISVGKAEVNESGLIVPAKMSGDLTALELNKFYPLPAGFYYLKNVSYAADTGSGAPYWGPMLDSRFENQLFEVKDGRITERTINFDVFGWN